MDKSENKKLKVLFQGWLNVPHSYAIVNCFQLLHLYKNYKDVLEIYVLEAEYFRKEWNNVKALVYGEESNNIIRGFKKWSGEEVHLVYNITYPYDVTPVNVSGKDVPKCVFYTSEFAALDTSYFKVQPNIGFAHMGDVVNHINKNKSLYFTSPSVWSSTGLNALGIQKDRNRIITHGVDVSKFYKNKSNRKGIRDFYKVGDDDILLLSTGAMTQNKGIMELLVALNIVVNVNNKKNYKLLLKGTGDLYQSRQFLESYLVTLLDRSLITKDQKEKLLDDHIIFTDKTFSYERINDLYNAADLYVSPYLAEGFGLVPLEALTAGLPVLVPRTGSTKEYMEDIYSNGGEGHIYYIDSQVAVLPNDFKQNMIDVKSIIEVLLKFEGHTSSEEKNNTYIKMRSYISDNYSWDKVSHLLYDYLTFIVKNNVNNE
uniref:Glycosyl transferase family 1 domain-containing protein n=1 Tax=viral metagenome TaxID=1070528 RepID=A0A6C0E219_9ZZZZ